jgi:hypothetical protein
MISQQYVFARKRTALKRDVYILSQTNDRRRMNRQLGGVEHVAVMLLHARHALENHHHRAPLSANIDRLE